jgi:dTDP-4-dehydrorhamnose reductase
MKILVTGADGQLGRSCKALSMHFPEHEFYFTGSTELSITDQSAVEAIFSKHAFDYCINTAAYTAVDLAESEPDKAMQVNAEAVGYLASVASAHRCRLIHISTDYVFSGEKSSGYLPDDATGPLNVYGLSKLKGEQLAMAAQPDCIIIRTSWVYSPYGKNFVKTMMKLMQERDQIGVVDDQLGKPTYAADLADAIFNIIFNHSHPPGGIYHYANEGEISWHTFAMAIQQRCAFTCEVKPILTSDFPTPAKRPRYSTLDTRKIKEVFGIVIPDWKVSLNHCLQLLQTNA